MEIQEEKLCRKGGKTLTKLIHKIDGVIFDLDGTLIASEHINVAAGKKIFQELGQPLSEEEEKIIPGKSSLDSVPIFLAKRGFPEAEYWAVIEKYRLNYDAIWETEVRLMPQTKETLAALRSRGKRIAIATTNRKNTVEKVLERFELRSYFDCYASTEDVTKRKPDPEIYNIAKMRLGLPDNALIAVEDTEIGAMAAKGAGLICAAIPSEYSRNENFRMADFVLASLGELPGLVK